MNKKTAVLYGGPSTESAVSLRSGTKVHQALLRKGINAHMVEYAPGVENKLRGYDNVFNIMHGRPGEDGTVQGLLESMNMPYTGSGVIPCAITINKYFTQTLLSSFNVPVLKSIYVNRFLMESGNPIQDAFSEEVIVKPNTGGSSVGTIIAKPAEARAFVMENLDKYSDFIIEDAVQGGIEFTVGIIEENGGPRVLTPLQLKPLNKFYDYEAKYTSGMTEFIIPPQIDRTLIEQAKHISAEIFRKLKMKTFARVDFIVKGDAIYELEVNSIPGMTDVSDLPYEAAFDGIEYDELVLRLLNTAGVNKDA